MPALRHLLCGGSPSKYLHLRCRPRTHPQHDECWHPSFSAHVSFSASSSFAQGIGPTPLQVFWPVKPTRSLTGTFNGYFIVIFSTTFISVVSRSRSRRESYSYSIVNVRLCFLIDCLPALKSFKNVLSSPFTPSANMYRSPSEMVVGSFLLFMTEATVTLKCCLLS